MAARPIGWRAFGLAAALCACVAPAAAQDTAWRCTSRGGITYSQVPCPGARPVGPSARHSSEKWRTPPQDRALVAWRARLAPEQRQECGALDERLREQRQALRARGEGATLQDEMPLVETTKRFRELRC